jgi:hypothetical protein
MKKLNLTIRVLFSALFTSTFCVTTWADESVIFTIPVNLDNVKYEGSNAVPNRVSEPDVLIGCWVASATGAEKGVKKDLVRTTNGSYHGQVQMSVLPNNPTVPFQKGDKWLCSINVNSAGWANYLNNYLTPANKPAAGQLLRMVVGGNL